MKSQPIRLRALLALGFALALGLASLTRAGLAQEPAAAKPTPERRTVEQKVGLVDRLLHDSPVSQRVLASSSGEARAHFAAADTLFSRSQGLLGNGEIAAADRLLTEAMWQIGKARELVPAPVDAAIEYRVRYTQLAETMDSLLAAYRAHVARLSPALAAQSSEDLQRLTQRIEQARTQAAAEQFRIAYALLETTQRDLLVSHRRLLGAETIVYDRRFASGADELRFETERNRDYDGLVPVALREFRPGAEARARVDQLVTRSRTLATQAQRQAQAGDTAAAIRTMQESTDNLQRALAAAGLVVPQSMPQATSR